MTGTGHRGGPSRRSIPVGPDAPRIARRFVAETLAGHPRLDDIVLATSELATNAVRHADGRPDHIEIEIHRADPVHVSVSHEGRFDPSGVSRDDPGGFGLRMMTALVDRWGIDERAGVRAWFEVR